MSRDYVNSECQVREGILGSRGGQGDGHAGGGGVRGEGDAVRRCVAGDAQSRYQSGESTLRVNSTSSTDYVDVQHSVNSKFT